MDVGVYGMGRFGAFWAQELAKYHRVKVYNRSDRPLPVGVMAATLEEVCLSETLFLCTAINSLPDVLRQISPLLGPGTLVADTCSVKVMPSKWMLEILPPETPLLATHPMFGPDSAKAGTQGLPLVLYPLRHATEGAWFWKKSFETQMGLQVLEMTPDEHDRTAAYTQGITHLIGRVLGDLKLQPSPMATKGYRSLLEIVQQTCNDPYQLFLDLQTFNPYTKEMRHQVQESFTRTREVLETALDTGTSGE
ncbi:MAG: hypothetical protein A2Z96_04645 [Spirochaetes bacterium GWB1_48_6]|nr:MAG: hypothetical protein A2Z96_04645 [Spirochaetes bacterium GWB1_48_6]